MNILPNSFEPISLKRLASLNPYVSLPKSGAVDYVPMENIHQGYLDHQTEEISSLPSSLNAFSEGDILLAKVTPCFENGNIAIASNLLTGVGLCSTELFVLRIHSDKILPEYLMLLLQDGQFKKEAKSYMRGTGGLKRIPTDWLMSRKFLIPSLKHQRLIIQAMSSSDSLIQDIQKGFKETLDRLSSYRQSLITRAVTKGLDPNVEMKDSGVAWIGKIPRNFKTIKLKYCLKSPLQYGATESGCAEEENYIRYIRITDINPSGFLKENGKLYLPKEIAEQYPVKTKDILFARSGATVGKTYFHNNKDDCCFAGYLIKASLSDSKILPKFFYYFTKSACYDFWKDITLSKATIQNISADRLNDLSVVCPPIQDQIQIIKFCDDLINETEAIAEIIKTTCNLLIEYRTSLISAAVTGQLAIDEEASA